MSRDLQNAANQIRFNRTAIQDAQIEVRRNILFDSMATGSSVHIVQVKAGEPVEEWHYYGIVNAIHRESNGGSKFNIELDSNPGLLIHVDLSRPCVEGWVTFKT